MKSEDATRILLVRKKTTARLRKQCARARETVMRSETPIYKEETAGEPTEYFSSKPSELTAEQRFALRLRRATRDQLLKWIRRNVVRESACSGIAERINKDASTSELRRREKFVALAARHDAIVTACLDELRRREEKVASRGN